MNNYQQKNELTLTYKDEFDVIADKIRSNQSKGIINLMNDFGENYLKHEND